MIDLKTNNIIELFERVKERTRNGKIVCEGNYDGTSGGMEGDALRDFIQWAEDSGLLDHSRSDSDLLDGIIIIIIISSSSSSRRRRKRGGAWRLVCNRRSSASLPPVQA